MSRFRAHARHTISQRVSLRAGDSRERDTVLENVGFGGARLRMVDPPVPGTIVRVAIATATAWQPLELDAVVRWRHEGDEDEPIAFGIELSPLTPATALALDEWLDTLIYEAPRVR